MKKEVPDESKETTNKQIIRRLLRFVGLPHPILSDCPQAFDPGYTPSPFGNRPPHKE